MMNSTFIAEKENYLATKDKIEPNKSAEARGETFTMTILVLQSQVNIQHLEYSLLIKNFEALGATAMGTVIL